MDINDWQFERLSRSSVKRLREDGMDLKLISIGNKSKQIESEKLLHIEKKPAISTYSETNSKRVSFALQSTGRRGRPKNNDVLYNRMIKNKNMPRYMKNDVLDYSPRRTSFKSPTTSFKSPTTSSLQSIVRTKIPNRGLTRAPTQDPTKVSIKTGVKISNKASMTTAKKAPLQNNSDAQVPTKASRISTKVPNRLATKLSDKIPNKETMKQPVEENDYDRERAFLLEFCRINNPDVIKKLAAFARSIANANLSFDRKYFHVQSTADDDCEFDDDAHAQVPGQFGQDVIIEEPESDSDSDPEIIYSSNPLNPVFNTVIPTEIVRRKPPRVVQIGQTCKTTVSYLKDTVPNTADVPNVPVVRLDRIVSRVVDVGDGRRIEQMVPKTAAEHIDPTTLTPEQIGILLQQGFVLESMNPVRLNAILRGEM